MGLDIHESVEKTWEKIIPSVVEVSIIIFVAAYIFGLSKSMPWFYYAWDVLRGLPQSELAKILESYQTLKVLPVGVVFVFLSFAYQVHWITHKTGSLIPVHFSSNATAALIAYPSQWDLERLLKFFPQIVRDLRGSSYREFNVHKDDFCLDINRINLIGDIITDKIDKTVLENKPSLYSGAAFSRRLYWKQLDRFNLVKFMILWAFVAAAFSIAHEPKTGPYVFMRLAAVLSWPGRLDSLRAEHASPI